MWWTLIQLIITIGNAARSFNRPGLQINPPSNIFDAAKEFHDLKENAMTDSIRNGVRRAAGDIGNHILKNAFTNDLNAMTYLHNGDANEKKLNKTDYIADEFSDNRKLDSHSEFAKQLGNRAKNAGRQETGVLSFMDDVLMNVNVAADRALDDEHRHEKHTLAAEKRRHINSMINNQNQVMVMDASKHEECEPCGLDEADMELCGDEIKDATRNLLLSARNNNIPTDKVSDF